MGMVAFLSTHLMKPPFLRVRSIECCPPLDRSIKSNLGKYSLCGIPFRPRLTTSLDYKSGREIFSKNLFLLFATFKSLYRFLPYSKVD